MTPTAFLAQFFETAPADSVDGAILGTQTMTRTREDPDTDPDPPQNLVPEGSLAATSYVPDGIWGVAIL